jgi:hypothetical protein
VPAFEGGFICKRTSTYYIKGDVEINKDQIKDVYDKKPKACSWMLRHISWQIQMHRYENSYA